MSYNHMAELLALEPGAALRPARARATSRSGFDADLVLVDPHETFVVRAAESPSQQGYTPFEGQELTGA